MTASEDKRGQAAAPAPPAVHRVSRRSAPVKQPVITIRDVAREAQVAISTVSRVLNGSAPASAEARERVSAAAARLGYRPSETARGLRRARTMTVGVVIPDLANPVFVRWVRGAEELLQRDGYSLFIGDGQNSWERVRAHLGRFYERRVDGLLIAGLAPMAALKPFFEAGTPVVPDPRLLTRGEVPRAAMEAEATEAAYRALVECGHRRIAFISRRALGSSPTFQAYRGRVQLLNRVLAEVGAGPATVFDAGGERMEKLGETIRQLATSAAPPTAYIAGTHVLAAPLLSSIYDAGMVIPRDVSLLAFGDSEWTAAHRPPISVVRHDYHAEAASFAARLLARMQESDVPENAVPVASEFVRRESIAAPRLD